MSGDAYRPQLDTLRAVAVSAVLVHHFLPMSRVLPEEFITLGLLAVRLFFVLSGYLITGILLRSRQASLATALRQFYVRRVLRIFPIYYLTLLVLVVLDVPPVRPVIRWHALYLSNVLVVLAPLQLGASTGHLWTLAVEEQFYLVWPFLILFVPYRHLLGTIIGVIGMNIGWKTIVAYYPLAVGGALAGGVLMPACLDSLGLGALLAFVEHDRILSVHRRRILRCALGTGAVIVALQFAAYLSGCGLRLFTATSYLGVSLVFAWLVGRAAEGFGGKLGRLLEWKPFLYIGTISYGMYLYHNFMPRLIRWMAREMGVEQPGTLMVFVLASSLTIAVATVSWWLVERPIRRLKETLRVSRREQPMPGLACERPG